MATSQTDEIRGPLCLAATFYTPHEAALASAHLTNEGIPNEVWDAHLVATDPLLAVAVRGVKVMVPESVLGRAKAMLDPRSTEFSADKRPVFRVRGHRVMTGAIIGGAIGIIGGAAGGGLFNPGPYFDFNVVLPIVGLAVGLFVGSRMRADTCSEPSCGGRLPVDATHCAKCGGELRGEIDHINDRLTAEEALPDYQPEAHDHEDEDDSDDVDEDGSEMDEDQDETARGLTPR